MRCLNLVIKLIGLSALLLRSIVGSFIIIGLYLLFVGLALGEQELSLQVSCFYHLFY